MTHPSQGFAKLVSPLPGSRRLKCPRARKPMNTLKLRPAQSSTESPSRARVLICSA